jgi:anti-sigma B factor antagonist
MSSSFLCGASQNIMPIAFRCSQCGREYEKADQWAGKTVKCEDCGQSLTVPFASAAWASLFELDEDGPDDAAPESVGPIKPEAGAQPRDAPRFERVAKPALGLAKARAGEGQTNPILAEQASARTPGSSISILSRFFVAGFVMLGLLGLGLASVVVPRLPIARQPPKLPDAPGAEDDQDEDVDAPVERPARAQPGGRAAKPRRHLAIKIVDGVTVVNFLESKIVTEEDVQDVGDQLYGLVENEGHKNILLNFGNVQYLSSAALGKLINLKKKVAAVKGRLKFCCIHPDLLEVFRITRLDQVFEIHGDERSALDKF